MACGVRPISNVVDVTNYILLELGQPLHAFDFAQVGGSKIVVRMAAQGEKFVTLDGQERTLTDQDLMICDADKAVGLAGVMGGLNSEVTDDTGAVLIESAFFDPLTIRRTSKRLGLSTEASYRFERGIDLEGCARAGSRAALLMQQLAEGQVAAGIIDLYPAPYQAPSIPLSISRTARYLGMELTKEQVKGQLERLGLIVSDGPDDDSIVAQPRRRAPTWSARWTSPKKWPAWWATTTFPRACPRPRSGPRPVPGPSGCGPWPATPWPPRAWTRPSASPSSTPRRPTA